MISRIVSDDKIKVTKKGRMRGIEDRLFSCSDNISRMLLKMNSEEIAYFT